MSLRKHFQNRLRRLLGPFAPRGCTSNPTRVTRHATTRTFTPRLEPLEDRRMLSVTLFIDADAPAGGDGLAWATAYDSLQSALESAAAFNADQVTENDVDAIWIAEGVYRPTAELEPGTSRSASFSLVHGVTLYGGFAGTETQIAQRDCLAHQTVLSGDLGVVDDTADNAHTVVFCGGTVAAGLDGVTVTGGNADGGYDANRPESSRGGGVYSDGTLIICDSAVSSNSANGGYNGGGGIYSSGVLTVIRGTISDNSTNGASRHGGGIYSVGTLTITDSTVSGNTVNGVRSYGGGIWSGGTLTVTDTTFSENSACYAGGAIWNSGTLTVNRSGFLGNVSGAHIGGGGIHNSGTATVADSIFSGNVTSFEGGAIYNAKAMTIVNSVLSGNSAHGYYGRGGGICNVDTLMIANCTLAGNSASYEGGGIYNRGAAFLGNTIVANNAAPSGPDIDQSAGPLTGFHNLIGNGTGQAAFVNGTDGNLIGTPGIPVDPSFLRPPSDGGDGWGDDPDTPDIDESANDDYGDLRLLRTSPAIDAGDNALAVDADGNPLAVDLAGNPRIFGGTVDVGAYEALEFIPGDVNLDQSVDSTDLDIIRANWGRTVPPGSLLDGDASLDSKVNSADLDIVRANWGAVPNAAAVDVVFREEGAGERLGEKVVGESGGVFGPVWRGEVATAARDALDFRLWMRMSAEAAWLRETARLGSRQ